MNGVRSTMYSSGFFSLLETFTFGTALFNAEISRPVTFIPTLIIPLIYHGTLGISSELRETTSLKLSRFNIISRKVRSTMIFFNLT